MMPGDMNQRRQELIDQLLDDLPVTVEECALAGLRDNDPEVAAAKVLQSDVDLSLRRVVPGVPNVDTVLDRALTEARRQSGSSIEWMNGLGGGSRDGADSSAAAVFDVQRKRSPWISKFAAAAAIGAMSFAGWSIWKTMGPPGTVETGYQVIRVRGNMEQVYMHELADDFNPDWVCDDDKQFAETFERELGQRMLFRPGESVDVLMVGLAYNEAIGRHGVHMLGRAGGREVIVFAGRTDEMKVPPAVTNPALHLFRRDVGALTLFELTPLDEAKFLERFVMETKPEAGESGG